MIVGFAISILPILAIISGMLYLPFAFYITKRFGRQAIRYHFVRFALVGYWLSLIYLTILWYYPHITFRPEYHFLNLKPFVWVREIYDMGIEKMVQQLVLNIGMFVPLGLLLPMAAKKLRRFWPVSLTVLASTVGIETIQYFMGRSADIDDVIMNAIGGILGYLLFAFLNRVLKEKEFWIGLIDMRSDL